jgi:hypothetical protein
MVAVTYGVTRVPAAKAAERVLAAPRKSFFARFMDAWWSRASKPFIVRSRATRICCRASSMKAAIG